MLTSKSVKTVKCFHANWWAHLNSNTIVNYWSRIGGFEITELSVRLRLTITEIST